MMEDARTTWLGALGEGLKMSAPFVPPPFTAIPLVLGAVCTGMAFYFAKDREKPRKEPAFHVDPTPDARP